ncbi:MAG: hypothetical protein KME04_05765 [Pleurocapsa minor GSE-CHR-MK-17-07R]|jgi:hypothetical protein|nr:hypothetical protein [Pleurocapsa minor GSE-CHR-MK 17-07R]
MAQSARVRFRKQVRGFAFLWFGITVLMASAAFIAIYLSYGSLTGRPVNNQLRSVALPTETAVLNPTPTPSPTLAPDATEDAQAEVVAQATPVAQEVINPASIPTTRPIDVTAFELGTQVQVSYDRMGEWVNVARNQLDVRWVKMQVRWENMELADDQFDWFETDTFLPAAQAQGLRVLLSIVTAPDWSREPGVNLERHGPPADFREYVEFVTQIVERYPGMVHAIEVWNEQNLDREWTSTSGLSAANYVTLMRQTYAAVKAIDPGIIMVSGALSPTGVSDGVSAWDDFIYMDQMIEAGLLDVTDCVGAHHNGYNISPLLRWDQVPDDPTASFRGPFPDGNPHHSWSFRSTLETYVNKVRVAGGNQPLCVTEFGWASADSLAGVPEGLEFAFDNSIEEQAQYTVEALDLMSESGDVRLAFLWNLNYGPQAGWSPDNENVAYSLIAPEFIFRPAFDAARDWNRAYMGRTGLNN